MHEFISQPWPWYVAGPLIGLMVPMLLLLGNKKFGVSSSLRHICASTFRQKSLTWPMTGKKKSGIYSLSQALSLGLLLPSTLFQILKLF